ncbi:MAG: efflux RND transporter periplasmic adaptor subunit [Bacteroidota bacterium]|nr:efflux RND transporter periplasmic adaptor subunit [Bacteroidota bacterium]
MRQINVLTSILFAVLLVGCGSKTNNTNYEPVIPVEVHQVGKMKIERTLDFAGTVMAWRETNLGAQTSGRIEKIFVKEGDEVKEGDVLVQMDDTQLTQARIQCEIAKEDFTRMKPLFDEGSISPQQFDKVKAGYETTKSTYELILRNTQLRAPFSGVITAKRMNEGEVFLLAPGAGGAPAIVNIMQIDVLKILVNVAESNFPNIRLGQTAAIEVDVYPNQSFSGTVSRVDPAINPMTRTFAVEVKVPNSKRILRPGMFARVMIKTGDIEALIIPRSALIKQLGTNILYTYIIENDTAKRRQVILGKEMDEIVEVISGLDIGNQLVVKGMGRLKDGSPAQIVSSN